MARRARLARKAGWMGRIGNVELSELEKGAEIEVFGGSNPNFVRTCTRKTHSPFSRAQINAGYADCEHASIRETLGRSFFCTG